MSHFTKCALKMTNLAAIKKALADMELQFTEAEQGQSVSVRGYRGDKLQAAIAIDMGRYDIGVLDNQDGRVLVWNDTSYQFIKRQSQTDSRKWVGIDDTRVIMASAAR